MAPLAKRLFGKKALTILLVASLILFLALTALVVLLPPSRVDRWFSTEVQEHGNTFFDAFMKGVSFVGYAQYSMPMAVLVSLIFFLSKMKKEAVFVLLTLLSGLVSSLVKFLVNRPRPTKDLVKLLEATKEQSFPSGHVLFYTVFFGFLCFLMFRLKQIPKPLRLLVGTFCLLMVTLVSISRIYLGAHWLTDVIGGYLLGYIILYALVYIYLGRLKRSDNLED
jgi:membrane-associated phospholipid phosphatase